MEDLPSSDRLLTSAARFLIDGGEEEAASVLLSCSLELFESGDSWYVGDEVIYAVHVSFIGPRVAYDILSNTSDPVRNALAEAISAVLPDRFYIKHFNVRAELVDIDPDWRTELLEIARGRGVYNQAAAADRVRIWNNLRFRSQSEVMIAQALDRAGVLFLPNCLARLGISGGRRNREADFLICRAGQWGILEVDGEPFHPPSRTVQDHMRDRLFRNHGIPVVEHFDASECFEHPDKVVAEFLAILDRS